MTATPIPQFQPGSEYYSQADDTLFAGSIPHETGSEIITGSAIFRRGTVLGRITVSGNLTVATSAATDGSQNPMAVLLDYVDCTAGDVPGAVAKTGDFDPGSLILGAGMTLGAVKTAFEARGLFLHSVVSATPDP